MPTFPGRTQESQAPPQAVLQHTPSTQLPLPHWLAAEQAPPLVFFGAQVPASQKLPELHCESLVQVLGQLAEEPLQTKAPHEGEPALPATTGLHVPTLPATLQASHEPPQAVLQHTPSTHWPLPHWLVPVQVPPFVFFGTHAPALQ